MIVHRQIQFDDNERDEIIHALQGIVGSDSEDDFSRGNVLRRFLNSARDGETFSATRLDDVLVALLMLTADLVPQAFRGWWDAVGAPGGDDAVNGLALERQLQVARLNGLVNLVSSACTVAGSPAG